MIDELQKCIYFQLILSMLEYLILNGKFEAAKHFHHNSPTSLKEELLTHFNKGNRVQFMDLFSMLHKQSKLQFYIRVYFLIYSIHPALRGKSAIPEPEKIAFKDYLDNKGAQLAKTNQFLQFYALPFIKKPLEHLAFKNLFKKEWVTHLKEKLQIYISEQERILKTEVSKLFDHSPNANTNSNQAKVLQQNVKQMQKINKKLFQQVKQFAQKYQVLEDGHKTMIDGFHTHMLQSQSKWFQITKQLVDCSKTLISMLLQSNSVYLSDKRFIKIKKRTEKYERFVNKKFDDLMNHEQDISIFDKPSINDLSCSVTPHTQKSLFANNQAQNGVSQYIATDYIALKMLLKKGNYNQKITVLNGLYWRILKSRDKRTRKLNILGVLQYDVLGIKSGQIQQMLISRQLMKPIVRFLQLISLDNHGKRILFSKNSLHRDLIGLVSQCQDVSCLEYIIYTLGQISSEKYFKLDLINQDIIEIGMGILRSNKYEQSQTILQNTVAILLNMLQKDEGLRKFEKQKDVFDILKRYTKSKFKITRTLTYGIIFSLLESQYLFKKAQKQRLPQYFDNIQNIDPSINKTQLKFLKDKLLNYQPKQDDGYSGHEDQYDLQEQQDDDFEIDNDYIPELDQMLKCHQQIQQKYTITGKQASKQVQQVRDLLEEYMQNRVPRFHNLDEQNKNVSKVSSPNPKSMNAKVTQQSVQTPYIKQANNKYEPAANSERPAIQKKVDNYFENDPSKNNVKDKPRQGRMMAQRPNQQIQNQERRMRKSISADRGIGRNQERQDKLIYQSNKFTNGKVSEFKPSDDRNYRSPQQNKKPREQVLKQLNEHIKAQQMMKSKKKTATQYQRENQAAPYASQKPRKPQQQGEAFQSRPKLRRTPPRQ